MGNSLLRRVRKQKPGITSSQRVHRHTL